MKIKKMKTLKKEGVNIKQILKEKTCTHIHRVILGNLLVSDLEQ